MYGGNVALLVAFLSCLLFKETLGYCIEFTCTAEYQGFTPALSQGRCAAQINIVRYRVKHTLKTHGCSVRACTEKDRGRFACKLW